MAAWQWPPRHGKRALFLPIGNWRENPMHDPAFTPNNVQRTCDLLTCVRSVMFQIDTRARAVVLAHRVHCTRKRKTTLVLGDCTWVENVEPLCAPTTQLGAQVKARIGCNQSFWQRRRLDQ